MRRSVQVIVISVLVATVYPVYRVGVAFGFWQPATRPAGVSHGAHYVEDLKDAGWFDCSLDVSRDVNVCRAWDANGKLAAIGNYRLEGTHRAATTAELRPVRFERHSEAPHLAWIYLLGAPDGKKMVLVPVNEAGEPLQRFDVRLDNDRR